MSITENIYDHCYKSKDSSLKNTALDKSHTHKIKFNSTTFYLIFLLYLVQIIC